MPHRAWLPNDVAKCVAEKCERRERCARWLVDYAQGRPVCDFSLSRMPLYGCQHFLHIDYHGPQQKRRAHPPIGSV